MGFLQRPVDEAVFALNDVLIEQSKRSTKLSVRVSEILPVLVQRLVHRNN